MKTSRGMLAIVTAVIGLTGCATLHETYGGKDPQQVWTAMVAVAQNPSYYDDWLIGQNNVWADDANWSIHLYRELRRDVIGPASGPRRESRTLKHDVTLLDSDEGPVIRFKSRNLDVPVRAYAEAELYFEDVWELLGGRPVEPAAHEHQEQPDAGPDTDQPEEDEPDEGDDELIDIDSLGDNDDN